MLNEVLEICGKLYLLLIIKANIKQQEIKDQMAVSNKVL